MSDRILRLVKGARQAAATVDAASKTFERELARVWRDLAIKLPPLVQAASSGNQTAIVKAAQANQLRKDLRKALNQSGYDGLADTMTGAPIDRVTQQVLANRKLAGVSAALSKGTAIRLEALRALHLGDLLDEGDTVARALWQATTRGVFSSRPLDKILEDLGVILDRSDPEIRTLYDTSISIYGRQVEALQAGDNEEAVFMYAHPVDEKTRPFCLRYAGRVMTRAEIDELDNGQLDNVYLTGGGYNCRGMFMEVSRFSELRDYVGSTKRVPEVAAQFEDLSGAA